jgi:hypothetical protein
VYFVAVTGGIEKIFINQFKQKHIANYIIPIAQKTNNHKAIRYTGRARAVIGGVMFMNVIRR